MGICGYCHQKAGWFKDAHDACVQKANAGIESVKKYMTDAVTEGKHYSDVSATIDNVTADAAIPQDQVSAALREGWNQGAKQRSKAQPVSEQEFQAILNIYRAGGLAAGLTEDEWVPKTEGAYALMYSLLTWRVLHDRIMPFEIPSEPPPGFPPNEAVPGVIGTMNPTSFNLQAGEVRVWGLANVLLKQAVTTTAYVGGYSGTSVRVAGGLWYRFGGLRGHKEESTSMRDLDCGELLITTRAIYYSGRATSLNFRLPFNQIIQFKPYSDAVGICKNGAREQILAPRHMVWSDGGISGPTDIGYYQFNLLQALATKDSTASASRPAAGVRKPVLQGEAALDAAWERIREARRKATGKDDLGPRPRTENHGKP